MVMKQKTMRKNLRQSIMKSLGRFLAIVAIIALGAGIFVGLNVTKTDMLATGQRFTNETNMFDLRLLSSYGWEAEHVEQVAALEGVADAEGMVSLDVLVNPDGQGDMVYRLHSIPERINKIVLTGGRMPQAPDECLAEGYHATDDILGMKIQVSDANEQDTIDSLSSSVYTVVGYVSTPLYLNMERGTTTIGSGSLAAYLYIPMDGFDVDYFTEIAVTIPGDYRDYSEEYNDALDEAADWLKEAVTPLAWQRLESVQTQAEADYAEGKQKYDDGMEEYLEGRTEANRELSDAKKKLEDGQKEIDDNRALLEDGLVQIQDGQKLLDDSFATMAESRKTLADAKADAYAQLAQGNTELLANYKTVSANLRQVNDGLYQLEGGLTQLNAGITQLESGLAQLDSGLQQIDLLVGILDLSLDAARTALDFAKSQALPDDEQIAELEARLSELEQTKNDYAAQREQLVADRATYAAQLEDLKAQRAELEAQKTELLAAKRQLDDAMAQIDAGFLEFQNSQTQVNNQFTALEAQLESGTVELEEAQRQLDLRKKEAEDGLAALEEAQAELDQGWKEYERGRDEANRELTDAWAELMDAKAQLADARETIDGMTETSVYALDRNTNVGYTALNNNSDIVAGVSRVFPVFFVLVAALVCITTMTRMVGEERTEIGTLKALGYSSGAIMSKYLFYAGSAALLGSGVGILLGCTVLPWIIWQAYCIMFYISGPFALKVDVALCSIVTAGYVAAMLLVTWYCCRKSLQEVPAELIRPKAPTSGKKIFLEHFRFWEKLSFLNKVMLRNIFRYRQRFLMMLLGIGGCTALLVTGFGLRDSIKDIAVAQFSDIMVYDMAVSFSEEQQPEDQEAFAEELSDVSAGIHFFHQSSAELHYDEGIREVYLIASNEVLTDYIDLHSGQKPISMPGAGEALVSIGAADIMGISLGDTVTIRDADMKELTLTVSGIFDNNVYSYVIVSPETIEDQWGSLPEKQVAYVTLRDGEDVHSVSAKISGMEDVLNVMVCQDVADSVAQMLDALDLVVVTIVVCAGLLAAIVLYNLININIKERLREIATIKVLGFNARETAAYVFKENLLLSVMGAVLGLPAGRLLLNYVMSQVKIDMLWIESIVGPVSYVLSFIMTMLSAVAVDFIFHFVLDKINMAEALKSVE